MEDDLLLRAANLSFRKGEGVQCNTCAQNVTCAVHKYGLSAYEPNNGARVAYNRNTEIRTLLNQGWICGGPQGCPSTPKIILGTTKFSYKTLVTVKSILYKLHVQ